MSPPSSSHHLVVQGRDIATPTLKSLARLTQSSRIERISAGAFRLCDAQVHADVAPLCAQASLDFAYVPHGRQLSGFRLAVMDMDSTLITIECIDEIAELHGVKPEVAGITARAMRGELDYAQSLRERVRLLAGMPQSALERVYTERLQLSPGAERMLRAFRRHDIRTLLVSGGFTFFTERLKTRLQLDATHANEPEIIDGKLTGELTGTIVDGQGKARALRRLRTQWGIEPAQTIGIGDGANDLEFLSECGVSVAYRAKPTVRANATHSLDHVGLDGVLNLFDYEPVTGNGRSPCG